MANKEHLSIIEQGVKAWNQWRKEHPDIRPDLSGADLSVAYLSEANLGEADLSGANLSGANLTEANLTEANLTEANLSGANLSGANLNGAGLIEADLIRADLVRADLGGATLSGANLIGAYLSWTYLGEADVEGARAGGSMFSNVDLSVVKGLDRVIHNWPSTVGIDTIYRSKGKIPEVFLRGCGVPDQFIAQIAPLFIKPIQYYSCFISYNHKDGDFAKRLHSRLRDSQIRVWFSPEDIKGGAKLYEQIDRAIQVHDRLLLVLSENSLQSEWVMTEIRKARKVELKERQRKLFPIRLVDFETIRQWECFDADTGKDLAVEVREYFIPDFSNWKDQDAFEAAFDRLLRDLKAESAEATE